MLWAVEGEFSRYFHVDLAGALQLPFEPLRRALVLDALAGRIRGAADRTERLVEIGDGFRRQTPRALLRRPDDAVDLRRLHGLPLPGPQAVGACVRRRGENERQRERAGTSVVKVHERHLICTGRSGVQDSTCLRADAVTPA